MVTGIPRVSRACQTYVFMADRARTGIALKYRTIHVWLWMRYNVVRQRIELRFMSLNFVTAQQEKVLN